MLNALLSMKKSKGYAPYLFAFFIPTFSAITHNLLFKSGLALNWIIFFVVILGLWHFIDWLLTISDNKLVKWGSVFLGSSLYSLAYIGLDYYVLQLSMRFTGFSPLNLGTSLFLITVAALIIIESVKWTGAREKARIDNLNLQSENIEAKFKLLREQVNPEFLFYCLTTLQTMVRTDDQNTEGYILKLADVYRQTLKKERNVVSLREELALLRSYMYLMRYGRETAVFFDVDVSDAALKYQLPVFALQLLGDNCVKHNVFSESQPLHIRLFQKDPHSITMTNNYQRNDIPKSYGIDMEHLEMRYALEGIEEGVLIEKEETTYSTTIKLF
jgi:two-component system, LytTR family, sensor kinase